MMAIIKGMKERIPKHPVLKEELEKLMIEHGMTEDEALNLMIYAWLKEKWEWME